MTEEPPSSPAPVVRTEVHIPFVTFCKVFAAILAGYAAWKLWPLTMLVFLAALVAVTLYPIVIWLDGRGLKRWMSLAIVIVGMLAVLGIGMALIVPNAIVQVQSFTKDLPALRDRVINWFPKDSILHDDAQHLLQSPNLSDAGKWTGEVMMACGRAFGSLSEMVVMLVIAMYLLIDGPGIYKWLTAFFSPEKRRKLGTTSDEISKVIFSYVTGQLITSALVTIYAYIVLTLLHVPAPLMLAALAGVFDILPILGIVLSTLPALVVALSVSPQAAMIVVAAYLGYHAFETYVIVPKVYGKTLRLSTLTVLLGLLGGSLLAGIPGALAALPILASYAVIEQIWLKPYLRSGVSEKHEQLKNEEFGQKA